MFELDQKFYRNDNDKLMLTLSVWNQSNKREEVKIFEYDSSTIQQIKVYLKGLKIAYDNISINWNRIMKEKETFLGNELNAIK